MSRKRKYPEPPVLLQTDGLPQQSLLTPRERDAYDFFVDYTLEHGYQPGLEEMAAAMGVTDRCGGKYYVNALVKKGWLARNETRERARAIDILRQPDGSPFIGLRFVRIPTPEKPFT